MKNLIYFRTGQIFVASYNHRETDVARIKALHSRQVASLASRHEQITVRAVFFCGGVPSCRCNDRTSHPSLDENAKALRLPDIHINKRCLRIKRYLSADFPPAGCHRVLSPGVNYRSRRF